jgi:hypothetical protein
MPAAAAMADEDAVAPCWSDQCETLAADGYGAKLSVAGRTAGSSCSLGHEPGRAFAAAADHFRDGNAAEG